MKYFVLSGFLDNFYYPSTKSFEKFRAEEKIDDEKLTGEEHRDFLLEIFSLLDTLKTRLYIADKDSKGLAKDNPENDTLAAIPSIHGYRTFETRRQQVLLMHYLAKGLEIKTRTELDVTDVSRFFHALLGWEYNNIGNTQLTKLLRQISSSKKQNKRQLYIDLYWVREQIEIIGLTDILELIDKEMKEIDLKVF